MDEPLQLTKEEIERIQRLVEAGPPMPDILSITTDDIAAAPVIESPSSHLLTITVEECTVVPPQANPSSADVGALEELMLARINAARRQHLPGWLSTVELTPHRGLTAVARGHATDMLRRHYVAHVTPEGVSAARRIESYGLSYLACGENIGVVYGQTAHTAQGIDDIHRAIMNQPRRLTNHRGNLLNPVWTHVGIGVAYRPDELLIVTQNYMCAPGASVSGR